MPEFAGMALALPDGMAAQPRPPAASPPGSSRPSWAWFVLLALLGVFWLVQSSIGTTERPPVQYSTFLQWVRAGKVKEAVVRPDSVSGKLSEAQTVDGKSVTEFRTATPHDERLVALLDQNGVAIRAENEESPLLVRLVMMALPWVVIIGGWMWLSRRTQQMMVAGGGPLGGFLKRGRKFEKAAAARVTFEDVAGLANAKRDLSELVQFLKQPELFASLGAKIPRGVLL